MPYQIEETPQGVYVVNTDTGKRKNKEPMSKSKAKDYMAALYAAEGATQKEVPMQIEDDWIFTLKDDTQDGIMIALAIPLEIAESLALEPGKLPKGAEAIPADVLHITLTYLGTVQEAEFSARDLMPVLSMFAMRQGPISGVLNGYGKFVTSHKDGLQVCYLNFDSPALPEFHHELLEALEEIGLEFEVNHGFTPHVTLAYVPEGKELDPKQLPTLPVNVSFDRIVFAYGDNWYEFYLSGSGEEEEIEEAGLGSMPIFPDNAEVPAVYSVKEGEEEEDELTAFRFIESTEKHLAGTHNQKRHGWSYGGGMAVAKRSMRNQSHAENEEYKNRARARAGKTGGEKPKEYGPYHKDSEMGAKLFKDGRKGETMELRSWDGKLDVDAKIINGYGFPMGLAVKFPHEKSFRKDRIMSKSDLQDYLSQFRPRAESSTKEFVIDQVLSMLTEKEGGYESAEPFLRWSPTQKENTLSRVLSYLTGLFVKKPVMTGQGPAFMTIKEKNGAYRWVSFSSNPYLDRDRQMVSLKALQTDVARADATGEYGPLLWWHTGAKLGDCDYNAMVGKILVESGTFISPEIGAAVSQKADDLQVSIGMLHPLTEPDPNGVFHNIKRYERSILPAGRASNPLTAFVVKEKNLMSTLDTQKEAQLINLLGPELANAVITQAGRVEKQAQTLGFTFAEKAKKGEEEEEMPEEDMEEEEMPPMPPAKKTKAAPTLAEMPADQFAALISGAVASSLKEALTPLETSLTALTQTQTQKDAAQAQKQEAQVKALKELGDKVAAQEQALEKTKKELTDKLAGISGDLPPALAALVGYRPSQAQGNITEKENIPNQPAPDPMGDFMKFAAPYVNGQ